EEARKRDAQRQNGPTVSSLARLKTEQLEARIEKIEARIKEIDAAFADPDVYQNPARCQALGEERQRLQQELEPLEFEWSQRAGYSLSAGRPRRDADAPSCDNTGPPEFRMSPDTPTPATPLPAEVTRLLHAAGAGDQKAASELLPLVYEELRKLARAK